MTDKKVTGIFERDEAAFRAACERKEQERAKANADCITALENALETAKAGHMVSLSVNWVSGDWMYPDDGTGKPCAETPIYTPLLGDGVDAGLAGPFAVVLMGTMKAATSDIFNREYEAAQ